LIKHKTLELISTASKQQALEFYFYLKNLKLIASCNSNNKDYKIKNQNFKKTGKRTETFAESNGNSQKNKRTKHWKTIMSYHIFKTAASSDL